MRTHAHDLRPQELSPGAVASSEARLAVVVLDAFDLAGAGYPVELIRRCVASAYPGARVSLVLRFMADTDTCWVPETVLGAMDAVWVPSAHSAAALPRLAGLVVAIPEVCRAPSCPPPAAPPRGRPLVFLAVLNDYGLDDVLRPSERGPLRWNSARKNLVTGRPQDVSPASPKYDSCDRRDRETTHQETRQIKQWRNPRTEARRPICPFAPQAGLLRAFSEEFAFSAEAELLVKSTRPGLRKDIEAFLATLPGPKLGGDAKSVRL